MPKFQFTHDEALVCTEEAQAIFERQKQQSLNLRDHILAKFPKDDGRKFTHVTMAKFHVLISMQLTGQVLTALREGMTLLASMGYRSLQEKEINTKYIYAHPKHKGDSDRLKKLAADFWRRSKFRTLNKARLDNKSIEQRAREVRKLGFYKRTFADMSGYPHNLAGGTMLNSEPIFLNKTVQLSVASVAILHNITEHVAKAYDLQRDRCLEGDTNDFVKKWNKWNP